MLSKVRFNGVKSYIEEIVQEYIQIYNKLRGCDLRPWWNVELHMDRK